MTSFVDEPIFLSNLFQTFLTDSNPVLSAFHAMTGIPRNPAIYGHQQFVLKAIQPKNARLFYRYEQFYYCMKTI